MVIAKVECIYSEPFPEEKVTYSSKLNSCIEYKVPFSSLDNSTDYVLQMWEEW